MDRALLILAIFLITYTFIAVQRIPGIRIDRPTGAMIGATLLLLTGLISIREAVTFIDPDVILFLLGMMIMIAYLDHAGFFEHVAQRLVERSPTSAHLLAYTIGASGLLSALIVNDTICLLFPPILLRATRRLGLNPVPYLIAIATAANFGSALTVTGNPQNMYIGIQSGIPFLRFALRMSVPVVLALAGNYWAIRLLYRREVNGQRLPRPPRALSPLRPRLAGRVLLALALTLGMFVAGLGYALAALIGASLLVLIGGEHPRDVLRKVDWTVLLFFGGLFVVMGAFEKAGYLHRMLEPARAAFTEGGAWRLFALALFVALLSNLVSNVPAVILVQPLIAHLGGGEHLWLLVALASTFAGNLTLVGSVANLIVAEKAQAEGVHVGFLAYLKVGLPLSLLALLLGTLWLALLAP